MKFFVHKTIKRFHIDGTIKDNNQASSVKETCLLALKDMMRLEGYCLLLDLDPEYTVEYNGITYNYTISVYGTFVGKKQALCMEGIYGARGVYTAQSKSEVLSEQQA